MPVMLDMLADTCRSRSLNVISSLFFISSIAFYFFQEPAATVVTVSKLDFATSLPHRCYFGDALERSPVVWVRSQANVNVEAIRVKATVTRFVSIPRTNGVDCSSDRLAQLEASLELDRVRLACEQQLVGLSAASDVGGLANFTDLRFLDGPPGTYTVEFSVGNLKIESAIEVMSHVASIAPIAPWPVAVQNEHTKHQYWKSFGSYSCDFPGILQLANCITDPNVLVLDAAGLPLAGIRVVAFLASHAGLQGSREPLTSFAPNKLGVLQNARSALSDVNGTARFTGLTIEGATANDLFVWFSCQGVTTSWHQFDLNRIYMETTVGALQVSNVSANGSVMEDEAIPPLTVRVIGRDGSALSNRWVFAMLPVQAGFELFEFQMPAGEALKFLQNAAAKTDDKGMATFSNLSFSIFGMGGDYSFMFACEGIRSAISPSIHVRERPMIGKWTRQPPSVWRVGQPLPLAELPSLYITVLTRDGMQEVPFNKSVKVSLAFPNGSNVPSSLAAAVLDPESMRVSATLTNGLSSLDVSLLFVDQSLLTSLGEASLRLLVTVGADFVILSREFRASMWFIDPTKCAHILAEVSADTPLGTGLVLDNTPPCGTCRSGLQVPRDCSTNPKCKALSFCYDSSNCFNGVMNMKGLASVCTVVQGVCDSCYPSSPCSSAYQAFVAETCHSRCCNTTSGAVLLSGSCAMCATRPLGCDKCFPESACKVHHTGMFFVKLRAINSLGKTMRDVAFVGRPVEWNDAMPSTARALIYSFDSSSATLQQQAYPQGSRTDIQAVLGGLVIPLRSPTTVAVQLMDGLSMTQRFRFSTNLTSSCRSAPISIKVRTLIGRVSLMQLRADGGLDVVDRAFVPLTMAQRRTLFLRVDSVGGAPLSGYDVQLVVLRVPPNLYGVSAHLSELSEQWKEPLKFESGARIGIGYTFNGSLVPVLSISSARTNESGIWSGNIEVTHDHPGVYLVAFRVLDKLTPPITLLASAGWKFDSTSTLSIPSGWLYRGDYIRPVSSIEIVRQPGKLKLPSSTTNGTNATDAGAPKCADSLNGELASAASSIRAPDAVLSAFVNIGCSAVKKVGTPLGYGCNRPEIAVECRVSCDACNSTCKLQLEDLLPGDLKRMAKMIGVPESMLSIFDHGCLVAKGLGMITGYGCDNPRMAVACPVTCDACPSGCKRILRDLLPEELNKTAQAMGAPEPVVTALSQGCGAVKVAADNKVTAGYGCMNARIAAACPVTCNACESKCVDSLPEELQVAMKASGVSDAILLAFDQQGCESVIANGAKVGVDCRLPRIATACPVSCNACVDRLNATLGDPDCSAEVCEGYVFAQQPVVRLFDSMGRPLPGYRVRARVFVPGVDMLSIGASKCQSQGGLDVGPTSFDYSETDASACKEEQYLLPFSLSDPSDAQGFAKFRNLLLTSVQSDRMHIQVEFRYHVESTIAKTVLDTRSALSDILVVRKISELTVSESSSAVVPSGQRFSRQPRVRLDYLGSPDLLELRYAAFAFTLAVLNGPGLPAQSEPRNTTEMRTGISSHRRYSLFLLRSQSCVVVDEEKLAKLSLFDVKLRDVYRVALGTALSSAPVTNPACLVSDVRQGFSSMIEVRMAEMSIVKGLQQPLRFSLTPLSAPYQDDAPQSIEVAITVKDVRLTSTIPSVVLIYQSFLVTALCTSAGGVPITDKLVSIAVSEPEPRSYAKLAWYEARSGGDGKLEFQVLFISGKPQKGYRIVFRVASEDYTSQATDEFELQSPVARINVTAQPCAADACVHKLDILNRIPAFNVGPVDLLVSINEQSGFGLHDIADAEVRVTVRAINRFNEKNLERVSRMISSFAQAEDFGPFAGIVDGKAEHERKQFRDESVYVSVARATLKASAAKHLRNGTFRVESIELVVPSVGDYVLVYEMLGFESNAEESVIIVATGMNAWEMQGEKALLAMLFCVPCLLVYLGNSGYSHRVLILISVCFIAAMIPAYFGAYDITDKNDYNDPFRTWFARTVVIGMLIAALVVSFVSLLARYPLMHYHRKFWAERNYTKRLFPKTLVSVYLAHQSDEKVWCSTVKPANKPPPLPTMSTGLKDSFREYAQTFKSMAVQGDDAFFFPQRIQIAVVSSAFFMGLTARGLFGFIQQKYDDLLQVETDLNALIFRGLILMQQQYETFNFAGVLGNNDPAFQQFFELKDSVHASILQFAAAIRNSANTGCCVAILVFVVSWVQILTRFRRLVLEARRGIPIPIRERLHVSDACNYAGLQASNAMLSFVVSTVMVQLLTFPLWYWPLLQYIGSQWSTILSVLLPTLVNMVAKQIFGYRMFANEQGIKEYRAWLLYDTAQLFASTYTGITTAITRVCTLIPLALISLMRLDEDIFPPWISRYMILDASHKAFMAAVHVHHINNHPIMLTFKHVVLEHLIELRIRRGEGENADASHSIASEDRSAELLRPLSRSEMRRNRVYQRWWTALTMITNGPSLSFEKPYRVLIGWSQRVDVHEFWFAARQWRYAFRPREGEVLSRSWTCQASAANLTESEAVVLVEYRVYCQAPHSGHHEFPGRWHFMAFSLDSALLWLHFGKFWNGELKPFLAHELRPDEKLLLDRFHDEAQKSRPDDMALDGAVEPVHWSSSEAQSLQRRSLPADQESSSAGRLAAVVSSQSVVEDSPMSSSVPGRSLRHSHTFKGTHAVA